MSNVQSDAVLSPFPEGIAVVIGGSGGIGRAVCRRLAECGSDVALTYRSNGEAAREAADDVASRDRRADIASLDLTDEHAVKVYFDDIVARFGPVHTLVVATGADMRLTYISDLDTKTFRDVVINDLVGFFHVVTAALPHLRAGGGGSIVALSSAAMVHYSPMDILSVAPKGGIEGLVRGIAREEGRNRIRANSVALGVIDAGLMDRLWDGLTPAFEEKMRTGNALRRIGTAEEAADAVVFLASARASYITGQRLVLDGGYAI